MRGIAREVLDRMGLTDAIRAKNTTETGTVIVDAHDKVIAELPSDGPDGATAELEVLRGDFARAILESLPAGVRFVYGEAVAVGRRTVADGVTIVTEGGERLDAALLVVAEGVRSRTRDLLFAAAEVDADAPRHHHGLRHHPAHRRRRRSVALVQRGRRTPSASAPGPHGTTRAILPSTREMASPGATATTPCACCGSATPTPGGRPRAYSTASTRPTTCTSMSSRRSGCGMAPWPRVLIGDAAGA